MPDLEGRVTALETRVDMLRAEVQHSTDLGITATREALTAREAHQRNIELLNALRTTQAEHSRTLVDHSRTLAEHTGRFDSIDEKLGRLALGMHTVESLLRRLLDED